VSGLFIVFEGGEGAGKSTQALLLYRRLLKEGHPALLTHEPGGTPLGEAARRWLKGRSGHGPEVELLLFVAARAQLVRNVIRPALDAGKVVVCDRYAASTIAYQGYGRGMDVEVVRRVNDVATGGLWPDLTVFLDVPPEAGLARKSNQSAPDSFESEALEFHRRLRRGFLAQAEEQPGRWLVLDGTFPKRRLAARIWRRVSALLK